MKVLDKKGCLSVKLVNTEGEILLHWMIYAILINTKSPETEASGLWIYINKDASS